MLDEDETETLRVEVSASKRKYRCQCGDDLPGTCPGVQNCPYVANEGEDDE